MKNVSNVQFTFFDMVTHRHQAKVLKYPLNENFLSLQIVTLKSQLIFSFWGHYKILKCKNMK
ncbi:hypothetical protein COL30_27620 [Bacillus pseudomycoides]|uniref:Transposase n=1 Tax=Bacillus pseudomycoides TaxID=64104 RepID=A0A2B6QUG0_9BACI|nr:hypothetical protein CON79_22040 [Bacillus pseudomycoides]PEA80588.1 hypothetical protein CON99_27450 [Bacillus pseudomycoides]PED06210.1 hypothetical protein COO19_22180 [Bacillus pseudomycoides]PED71485.1 hypothetical protein CON97_13765 [Bacillus pseudomycoides]PEI32896.1 hypothetical protein CN620_28235 [Bacillus pseudomycoides]